MANPARGEVAFRVEDEDYVLKFTTNAICKVEKELEEGLNSIVQNMQRVTTIRALLWAGLHFYRPNLTVPQTGDIIDRVGLGQATEAVGKALTAAFPIATEGDAPNA